jgi:hypothetical protein
MKKLLSTICGCCLSLLVWGQNIQPTITIKGTIIDSATNTPLGYVTVVIQNAQTKKPVKSTLAKDNGTFALAVPAGDNYQLVLAFTGYKDKLLIMKTTGTLTDLGNILLSPASKQLKEVSVSYTKPLMKQEIDRISYDVAADPETPVLSALDMMRKVPLLSVDASDNILLKGDGNYKILINGKESALMAKSPSDILKSMPATNIEKIEVITTPPAKYDAEGLSGIINIITKQKLPGGYNIGVNGRLNSVFGPGVNLNGTYKKDKFGLAAYMGFSHNREPLLASGSTQNFFQQQSTLTQSGTTQFRGNNGYGNLEMSYEIDTLNLLTASVDAFVNKVFSADDQLSNMTNSQGVISHLVNRRVTVFVRKG